MDKKELSKSTYLEVSNDPKKTCARCEFLSVETNKAGYPICSVLSNKVLAGSSCAVFQEAEELKEEAKL